MSNETYQSYVVYLSTYPPRKCGIAAFTQDLSMAMDKIANPKLKSKIIALNDNGNVYDYSDDDTDLGIAMLNSMFFVFYHEVGHVIIDVHDLPTTGNPEDNADQVSTLILLGAGESGIEALLDGANWFFIVSEKSNIEESMFSDIHSPDRRRYYNILCWIYGSDPQNGDYLITGWDLPEERAIGCEEEYSKLSSSWDRLLSPYLK